MKEVKILDANFLWTEDVAHRFLGGEAFFPSIKINMRSKTKFGGHAYLREQK